MEILQNGDELILVVDDEDSVRLMAQDMLEPYGYRVLLAEDGEQALDIVETLVRSFKQRIRTSAPIQSVRRISGWKPFVTTRSSS